VNAVGAKNFPLSGRWVSVSTIFQSIMTYRVLAFSFSSTDEITPSASASSCASRNSAAVVAPCWNGLAIGMRSACPVIQWP